MNKYKACELISLIFSHPTTSLFFIIFLSFLKNFSLEDIFLSLVIVSLLSISPAFFWAVKNKKSVFLENRKERHPFLLISSLILLAGSGIGKYFGYPLLYITSFLYGINTFAIFLFNFKIKPSVHIAGISGPVTYLTLSFGSVFSLFYLFSLPVGFARLKLKAHSLKEIIAGFFIASFTTWVLVFLKFV